MKASVWEYLTLMYDDETWPDTNPEEAIDAVWDNCWQAVLDLAFAHDEVGQAEQDESIKESLWNEADDHLEVVAVLAAPQVMKSVISHGWLI